MFHGDEVARPSASVRLKSDGRHDVRRRKRAPEPSNHSGDPSSPGSEVTSGGSRSTRLRNQRASIV